MYGVWSMEYGGSAKNISRGRSSCSCGAVARGGGRSAHLERTRQFFGNDYERRRRNPHHARFRGIFLRHIFQHFEIRRGHRHGEKKGVLRVGDNNTFRYAIYLGHSRSFAEYVSQGVTRTLSLPSPHEQSTMDKLTTRIRRLAEYGIVSAQNYGRLSVRVSKISTTAAALAVMFMPLSASALTIAQALGFFNILAGLLLTAAVISFGAGLVLYW